MKHIQILYSTEHRPYEIPNSKWKYYQEWNDVIFLHWQVDMEKLKGFLPHKMEVDTFKGYPWVSLVAFSMEKIRPRNLPYLSLISNFHEINVRTYCKVDGKAGVSFLSIEGGNHFSCKVAKLISDLPYRYSNIKRKSNLFESNNYQFNDSLKIKYQTGNANNSKDELDIWLTERYALFQQSGLNVNQFEIHHAEWPISKINIEKLELNYSRFNELLTNNPDRVHYSPGVKVLAWGKNCINKLY